MVARRALLALIIAALAGPALAHTPIVYGGSEVHWVEASTTYGIGWAEYPDWDAAVRVAFSTWSDASTGLQVSEDEELRGHSTVGDAAHMVVHDPDNSTGWFTDPSVVAVTPVWFDLSGRITDADIVLNGRDHSFSVDGQAGTFDLQAVLTHEVGHFYGFDHSGTYGASLYPYVYQQDTSPRSLAPDDEAAARSLDPAGQVAITGWVTRPGGAPIRGAHVVAVDASGHALAADVSQPDGSFAVVGLAPGAAVRVFAEPLDAGVRDENLFASIESDFQTVEWSGGPVALSAGQTLDVGVLECPAKSFSVTGVSRATFEPGGFGSVVLVGEALDPPLTFSVLGAPGVSSLKTVWTGKAWRLDLAVSPTAEPGHRSLLLTNDDGEVALAAGALEVFSPQPTITSVTPGAGSAGQQIVVEGSGFHPDTAVLIGGHVVVGSVVDAGRFEGTIPAGHGAVAVSLQNPDGRWARVDAGFTHTGESAADPSPPPWTGPAPAPAPAPPAVGGGGGGGGGGCALADRSANQPRGGLVALALVGVALTLLRVKA